MGLLQIYNGGNITNKIASAANLAYIPKSFLGMKLLAHPMKLLSSMSSLRQ